MRSVRARVALLGTILVAAALVVGALALRAAMARELTTNGDDLSVERAREIASQVGSLPPVLAVGDDGVAQVVRDDGTVVSASPNVRGKPAIADFRPRGVTAQVRTLEGPDDDETETYRVWGVRADGFTVYVGRSIEPVEEALATLTRALLLGLPVLTALLAGALWLLVGRALRPVEALREEVASISPHELARRVEVPATQDEVARLAVTMNGMLARLEEAAAREREFVGNASHELLGPVASLRTQLEVALAHPEGAQWQAVARDLLDDTLAMERLVKDLLLLARADAGQLALRAAPVDLADVVHEQAPPGVVV
jgi:signal transduction histidine kinase